MEKESLSQDPSPEAEVPTIQCALCGVLIPATAHQKSLHAKVCWGRDSKQANLIKESRLDRIEKRLDEINEILKMINLQKEFDNITEEDLEKSRQLCKDIPPFYPNLLSSRERKIIQFRRDGHTLKKIGKYFNVSSETIRQIEYKSLSKLQLDFNSKLSDLREKYSKF